MATDRQSQEYTLVVGLGMTGLSVARHLLSRGEYVVVADSRDIPPMRGEFKHHFPDIALCTGAFDTELFVNASRIVLSPGVPLDEAAVVAAREQGVEILGDIDLFAEINDKPVIAITGSNGKSTVTAMLTRMLLHGGVHAQMGGNIGTPVLELLNDTADVFVLELSSFQLDTLRDMPMLASVVLNISEDHMDRYADFDAYAASKLGIYRQARYQVVNLDDEYISQHFVAGDRRIAYTLGEPEEHQYGVRNIDGEDWLCYGDKPLINTAAMRVKGRHNVANALAAMALCDALSHDKNIDRIAACDALVSFEGLPHRMQHVAEIAGVAWYNDSKATNVGAAAAAIKGLPGRNILIAGGEGKDADFGELRPVAAEHLKAVVLIGRDAGLIEAALDGVVDIHRAADMKQAVELCASLASAGDAVLLSPACASFDMFDHYAHRGDVFTQHVRELAS